MCVRAHDDHSTHTRKSKASTHTSFLSRLRDTSPPQMSRVDYVVTTTSGRCATGHAAIVEGLTLATSDGATLIRNARLAIMPGRRYALVGPNGSGKSTLLQAIADGAVQGWPESLSVALVAQDIDVAPYSLLQNMFDAKAAALRASDLEAERDELDAELDAKGPASDGALGPAAAKAACRLGEIEALLDAIPGRKRSAMRAPSSLACNFRTPASAADGGWKQRLAPLERSVRPTCCCSTSRATNWT